MKHERSNCTEQFRNSKENVHLFYMFMFREQH